MKEGVQVSESLFGVIVIFVLFKLVAAPVVTGEILKHDENMLNNI